MHQLSVLCGGSGSSKFALAITRGLAQSSRVVDARFFSNVGDNFWHYGLYICPDVDILLYALAGMLDESKGWGITGTHSWSGIPSARMTRKARGSTSVTGILL